MIDLHCGPPQIPKNRKCKVVNELNELLTVDIEVKGRISYRDQDESSDIPGDSLTWIGGLLPNLVLILSERIAITGVQKPSTTWPTKKT